MNRLANIVSNTKAVCGALVALLPALAHAANIPNAVLNLDGTNWLVAADARNIGKQEQWWSAARPESKPTRVPGTMQEVLGEYHGVAWYWRTLELPRHPYHDGRYLLRFWSVDYFAEVWVNGHAVGQHRRGRHHGGV
jgi:hypothetical protein